ncbi:MAG: hypothetical protein ACYCVN_12420 [Acidimicrobiales bacterium]
MSGHKIVIAEFVRPGHWQIHCSCFATVCGEDLIDVHQAHEAHVASARAGPDTAPRSTSLPGETA